MRSLFTVVVLLFATQSFAQVAISPFDFRKTNSDLFSLSKNEPYLSRMVGSWNCIGAAGYSRVGDCAITRIDFSKKNKIYSIKVQNSKHSEAYTDIAIGPWVASLMNADMKIYNNFSAKNVNGFIFVDTNPEKPSDRFVLQDCTAYGDEHGDQVLICKTKGDWQDYTCDTADGCSQSYKSFMLANDLWSVFVKEGATEVQPMRVKRSDSYIEPRAAAPSKKKKNS